MHLLRHPNITSSQQPRLTLNISSLSLVGTGRPPSPPLVIIKSRGRVARHPRRLFLLTSPVLAHSPRAHSFGLAGDAFFKFDPRVSHDPILGILDAPSAVVIVHNRPLILVSSVPSIHPIPIPARGPSRISLDLSC